MEGGLRDRLAKPRPRVPPRADSPGSSSDSARELHGDEAAPHVRGLGKHVHGERAGHGVLLPLRAAEASGTADSMRHAPHCMLDRACKSICGAARS